MAKCNTTQVGNPMVLVIAAARKAKKKFPSGSVYFSGLFIV
jgi:hypothetical protein